MSGVPAVLVPLRVVGMDVSLTSTGLSDGVTHSAVQTAADDVLEARMDRIVRAAVSAVLPTLDRPMAGLVVMEGSAYSRNQQKGHEELAALRLMIRHRMWRLAVPVMIATPTSLKLFTTGYGKATKQQMAAVVGSRYGIDWSAIKVKDGRYDMVDALALAAMGYSKMKQPLETATGEGADLAALHPQHWASLNALKAVGARA